MAMIKGKRKETSANSIIRFDLTNFSYSFFSKEKDRGFSLLFVLNDFLFFFYIIIVRTGKGNDKTEEERDTVLSTFLNQIKNFR